MAGNIIPAIATTNAIIAGFIVMSAIRLLSSSTPQSDVGGQRRMFLKAEPNRPIASYPPAGPNKFCGICRDIYIPFKVDLKRITVGDFVEEVVKGWLGEVNGGEEVEWEVYVGPSMLADPDYEDLYSKTLAETGVERGKMITVRGERPKDGEEGYEALRPVQFCVCLP